MHTRLLHEHDGLRTFAVVFEPAEDPVKGLERFASEESISGAHLTAVGAFRRVTVGYFNWERKDYDRIVFDEQVEVLALTGNIGTKQDKPALHAHVVLGRADGTACGGHLLDASVRPTLEVTVVETPKHLRRRMDPETGLALIDLSVER
jgi:predicted DNA-binding protein with PD1-like motif